MPPAFILSQDQTLHLILTQTHLRLFISWNDILKYIKCFCSESTLYNFYRIWIVCHWVFKEPSVFNRLPGQKACLLYRLRFGLSTRNLNFFISCCFPSLCRCPHLLAARWVLDYSTTYPISLQAYFLKKFYFYLCLLYLSWFFGLFFQILFILNYILLIMSYLFFVLIFIFLLISFPFAIKLRFRY